MSGPPTASGVNVLRRPSATVALLLAVVCVPALLAYLVSSLQAPLYAARVEFVVNSAQQGDQNAGSATANFASLLDTRSMMEGMVEESGVEFATLESRFQHERVGDSNVLQLTISDPSKEQALRHTEIARDVFLGLTGDASVDQPAVRFLDRRLNSVRSQQARVRDRIAAASVDTDVASVERLRQLRTDADALGDEAAALQNLLVEQQAQQAQQASSVVALGRPYVLDEPVSPNPARAGAAGLVAGIAMCAVFLALKALRRGQSAVEAGPASAQR